MDMVLIYSGALKIGYALIALVAVAAFSLWLDRRIGALLTDDKHLRGHVGIKVQAYLEACL